MRNRTDRKDMRDGQRIGEATHHLLVDYLPLMSHLTHLL